jgi:hypothetical protein
VSAPLYQLAEQHRELQRFAEETEVDPQALLDTLEGLQGEIEAKAQSVAMFIRNIEADAEAIADAAKQMATRAKRLQERADSIRTYLLTNMQATGITKIACPYFTIALRKNPPRADVIDERAIPDRFRVWPEPPPPMIDKKALLDALKAGEKIPGAALAQSERVEIRV